MNRRVAEKLARLTIRRSTGWKKSTRLNGISINNYIYHYADLLQVTAKKSWYIGFGFGFVFALILGVVMYFALDF